MLLTRLVHRRLAGLLVIGLVAYATLPAAACGCGGYLPREGEAHVAQERALIRWDGTTEDIVMALDVAGRSREAAWILPVPAPATVQLADPRLFDALQRLTKPLKRVEYLQPNELPPTGGGPPDPVTVLERQTLGPFDVTTLAASETAALRDWLAANGYDFPPELQAVLEPYVAQGWSYVAVRLLPAASEDTLSGQLEPLWVRFESDQLIYPMRATALARGLLPVFLYVLAEHRVADLPVFDPRRPEDQWIGWSTLSFAQWIDPAALAADSPLVAFVPRRLFLTKFDIYLHAPERISEDFVFTFAASDERYHQVDTHYAYLGTPPWRVTPTAVKRPTPTALRRSSPTAAALASPRPTTEPAGQRPPIGRDENEAIAEETTVPSTTTRRALGVMMVVGAASVMALLWVRRRGRASG